MKKIVTRVQHPDWSRNAVIYELNVRQFSPEGTLRAILPQLGRLKNMGVDILWLMPINPIGLLERKGTLAATMRSVTTRRSIRFLQLGGPA